MSSAVIWIIFPLTVSVLSLIILNKPRLIKLVVIAVSLLLALFALLQPIGSVLKVGGFSLEIKTSLGFLGRALTFHNSDRFILFVIFFTVALFNGGFESNKLPTKTAPLSLASATMLIAAMAVEPFMYSAILIEVGVLLMVLLVTEKGVTIEGGLLKFMIYLSLAVPLILFAGWTLGGSQTSYSDDLTLSRAALFLGIGFALWLAVFPFHTWIPQFTQAVNPFLAGFVLSVLPVTTLMIMIDYISSLVWLREAAYLPQLLRSVGLIMIVTGGVWAMIEDNLKRLIAYAVLLESGFSLIMMSLQTDLGVMLLFKSILPRILGLALLALSLFVFSLQNIPLSMDGITSSVKKYPFASAGLIVALLSIAGFPLFASFPIRMSAMQMLGRVSGFPVIWIIIGMTAFLVSIVRLFYRLTQPGTTGWQVNESKPQILRLLVGILILILFGWIPNIFTNFYTIMITALPMLK